MGRTLVNGATAATIAFLVGVLVIRPGMAQVGRSADLSPALLMRIRGRGYRRRCRRSAAAWPSQHSRGPYPVVCCRQHGGSAIHVETFAAMMKRVFYLGICLLLLFEVANVFFIMPMPGSQRMTTFDLAYLLYSYRWLFRAVFGLMIVVGAPSALRAQGGKGSLLPSRFSRPQWLSTPRIS